MPVIHNGDALTELLGFVHIVRGKQDSHTLLVERSNAVPDEKPGLRIKAIGGFVEKQHIWCVHERAGEHQSLRHATRVVVYVSLPRSARPNSASNISARASRSARGTAW